MKSGTKSLILSLTIAGISLLFCIYVLGHKSQQAHDLISTLKSGWFLVDDVAQPNLDLVSTSLSDPGFNQNF